MKSNDNSFWKSKKITEFTPLEWELLCDGCALCCLIRIQDEDTDELFTTNVGCKLLDVQTCRCMDYINRFDKVNYCLSLSPELVTQLEWLPKTCAYRLIAEEKELPYWHHLVSGSRKTVHDCGISAMGRIISERYVKSDELFDYIVDWWE